MQKRDFAKNCFDGGARPHYTNNPRINVNRSDGNIVAKHIKIGYNIYGLQG